MVEGYKPQDFSFLTAVRISTTYRKAVDLMKEIANVNGYTLYDFSSDQAFLSDSTLFKDGSHLNANGAKLYTEKVMEDIIQ